MSKLILQQNSSSHWREDVVKIHDDVMCCVFPERDLNYYKMLTKIKITENTDMKNERKIKSF